MEILFSRSHLLHFLYRINHHLLTEIFSNSVTSCNHVWLGRLVAENEVRTSDLAHLLLPQVFWHILTHNTLWFLRRTNVLSVTFYEICHLINLKISLILKYLV